MSDNDVVIVVREISAPPPVSSNSWLKLFNSEVFDMYLHVFYLKKFGEGGTFDYLVNLLYKRSELEIDTYLPQICLLSLRNPKNTETLQQYLIQGAAQSMLFALKIHWFFQSIADDNSSLSDIARDLLQSIEIAVVNSRCNPVSLRDIAEPLVSRSRESISGAKFFTRFFQIFNSIFPLSSPASLSSSYVQDALSEARLALKVSERSLSARVIFAADVRLPNPYEKLRASTVESSTSEDFMSYISASKSSDDSGTLEAFFLLKQRRCDFLSCQTLFTSFLVDISDRLCEIPNKEERTVILRQCLSLLNEWLRDRRCAAALSASSFALTGVHIPLTPPNFHPPTISSSFFNATNNTSDAIPDNQQPNQTLMQGGDCSSAAMGLQQILQIHTQEASVYSSKKRAPYLLIFESADLDEVAEKYSNPFNSSSNQVSFEPSPARWGIEPTRLSSSDEGSFAANKTPQQLEEFLGIDTSVSENNSLFEVKRPTANPSDIIEATPAIVSVSASPQPPNQHLPEDITENTNNTAALLPKPENADALEQNQEQVDKRTDLEIDCNDIVKNKSKSKGISSLNSCLNASFMSQNRSRQHFSDKDGHQLRVFKMIIQDLIQRGIPDAHHQGRFSTSPPTTEKLMNLLAIPELLHNSSLDKESINPEHIVKENRSEELLNVSHSNIEIKEENQSLSDGPTTNKTIAAFTPKLEADSEKLNAYNDCHWNPLVIISRLLSLRASLLSPPNLYDRSVNHLPVHQNLLPPFDSRRPNKFPPPPSTPSAPRSSLQQDSSVPVIPDAVYAFVADPNCSHFSSETAFRMKRKHQNLARLPLIPPPLSLSKSGMLPREANFTVHSSNQHHHSRAVSTSANKMAHQQLGNLFISPDRPQRVSSLSSSTSSSTNIAKNYHHHTSLHITDTSNPNNRTNKEVPPASAGPLSQQQQQQQPDVAAPSSRRPLLRGSMMDNINTWRSSSSVWGELWENRVHRIRSLSPFGLLKSWSLKCALVKGGDDLRQELLAMQLIKKFKEIWDERPDLGLWLRPYQILVTGGNCGLMEFVPDTLSVDSLKQRAGVDSLKEAFIVVFGEEGSALLKEAKYRFARSHAAYSLVGYLLNVKDRHNGNILIDSQGHVIHIDYGFMLTNAPGMIIAFEAAAFKLTSDYMDVMGGLSDPVFEYYKDLIVAGFLEARHHFEKFKLIIEMMMSESSQLACFSGGQVLESLSERFMIGYDELKVKNKLESLIEGSINNWRSHQYDVFQRLTNGIR